MRFPADRPPQPAQRMSSCQKKPQLRLATALAAQSKVTIKPMSATTQQQQEKEKTWAKEKKFRQKMKMITEEQALTESRALQ